MGAESIASSIYDHESVTLQERMVSSNIDRAFVRSNGRGPQRLGLM